MNYNTGTPVKQCKKCQMSLPLATEYFGRKKNNKDGHNNICKSCGRKEYKKYYEENKEKARQSKREYYQNLPLEVRRKREKEKKRTMTVEERRLIQRNYYRKNSQYLLQQKRKWRDENKEAFMEIRRRRNQKRRATKLNLENNFSAIQWNLCKAEFDGKCAYCAREKPLEQEHFIPVKMGGEYTLNNIIPACRGCNARKSDKDFFEWYPTYEFYSAHREKKILKYLNYKNKIQQMSIL